MTCDECETVALWSVVDTDADGCRGHYCDAHLAGSLISDRPTPWDSRLGATAWKVEDIRDGRDGYTSTRATMELPRLGAYSHN